MGTKTIFFLTLLILSVNCKNIRNRRFIGGTYTSTITSTNVVTSLVPSSCVSVEPTLQPCRNVRFLNFPHFDTLGSFFKPNNTNRFQERSDKTQTTALGWGEYLGIYQPTVTVTQIELQTTIVQDPRVAVTYAVIGCRPQKLPSDLNRCETNPSTISILDILPTSTVAVPSVSSTAANLTRENTTFSNDNILSSKITDVTENNNVPVIYSSTTDENFKGTENSQLSTKPLPIS